MKRLKNLNDVKKSLGKADRHRSVIRANRVSLESLWSVPAERMSAE
jgi:hypothetical protein